METYKAIKILKASDLPKEWDLLAKCYFQKKEFFLYTEKYNPSKQRYYTLYNKNRLIAGACVYTLTIDLLTFINVRSPVKMQVVGIPATVAPAGIIGDTGAMKILLKKIFKTEKGLIVGMNISPVLNCEPAVSMRTMPTIVMNHNFADWEECIGSLRSDYRRRMNKIFSGFQGIKTQIIDCSGFDEKLYDLYLQIYDRSKSKLEKLSLEFFKNLPENYRLTTYSLNNSIISWHITLQDDGVLYFFFGGTDYQYNRKYNSYFNNIAGILKEAINRGYKTIDFGQTAEIPKTRLGGKVIELNLFVYHRNLIVKKLLYFSGKLLQYNRKIPETHVFKVAQ
jgi:hypothetical protein